jgi:hypothetical protein
MSVPGRCARCGEKLSPALVDGIQRVRVCLNGHIEGLPAQPSPRSERIRLYPLDEGTALERAFVTAWRTLAPHAPAYEPQYAFCPARKWRLDFAWPAQKVCVEGEGFDHRQHDRYTSDLEKYNALAAQGWRLFRFTMRMILDDPTAFVAMVGAALE